MKMLVDFSNHLAGCWPRLLWQMLFNLYQDNGGDLSQLDNLLIDYDRCKEVFATPDPVVEILWSFSEETGYTTWHTREKWDAEDLELAVSTLAYGYVFLIKFDCRKAIIENLTKAKMIWK